MVLSELLHMADLVEGASGMTKGNVTWQVFASCMGYLNDLVYLSCLSYH